MPETVNSNRGEACLALMTSPRADSHQYALSRAFSEEWGERERMCVEFSHFHWVHQQVKRQITAGTHRESRFSIIWIRSCVSCASVFGTNDALSSSLGSPCNHSRVSWPVNSLLHIPLSSPSENHSDALHASENTPALCAFQCDGSFCIFYSTSTRSEYRPRD